MHCDDGRVATGSHVILAVGSIPNSDGLGLDTVGIETNGGPSAGRSDNLAVYNN